MPTKARLHMKQNDTENSGTVNKPDKELRSIGDRKLTVCRQDTTKKVRRRTREEQQTDRKGIELSSKVPAGNL